VVNDGVKLVAVTPTATSLDGLAVAAFHPAPGDLAGLVAALLDGGEAPDGTDADLLATARGLLDGDITVALGRGSLAETAGYTVDAAAVVARTRPEAKVLPLLRRANINGALDMGLAPGLLPGRTTLDAGGDRVKVVWPKVPKERGLDATGILGAAAEGKIDVLVLLGADPLADFPDRELAEAALAGARVVVAVDLFLTESSSRADVVLAAAGPGEVNGTHTNLEGRISVLGQAVTPPGTARPAWMVAAELALRLGADLGLESVADIWAEITAVAPSHAGITAELLAETGDGVVAPLPAAPLETTEVTDEGVAAPEDADTIAPDEDAPDHEPDAADEELPEPSGEQAEGTPDATGDEISPEDEGSDRQYGGVEFVAPEPTAIPPIDSYALRLVASRTMYDDGTLTQQAPALAGLAAEAPLRVHPTVLDRLGVVSGTRVRAISPRATVTLPVVADPGVPRGVAAVAFRRSGGAGDLVDVGQPVTEVRVETT
jgi:predicted molibdopterin-dependent oxidoreductase YjgC